MKCHIEFDSEKKAKEELVKAKNIYSSEFGQQIDEWLEGIATSTEEKKETNSIDWLDVLEEGIEMVEKRSPWKDAWTKWWHEKLLIKTKALIVVLKKRCPPWEIRGTTKRFSGILGLFDSEIEVYYEVDHISKVVVFTKFAGLPGQGY